MRISGLTGNKNSFGMFYTTGFEKKHFDSMLKPHSEELNKITNGYDVEITTGGGINLHDGYNDVMISNILPTEIIIKPSLNSAYYLIPKVKLYVNPDANPCFGDEYEAKDIIETIKKGINICR